MEAEDALSQLADIHLPEVVSFWPPAPGWWVLAAIVLFTLGWLVRQQYLRWQQNQRLKRALRVLAQAYSAYRRAAQNEAAANQAGLDLLYAVNSLLKRVALVHYPEHEIAVLSGTAWLQFLDQSGHTRYFTKGSGAVLADGEYRPEFDADAHALYTLAREWVQKQYTRKKSARKTSTAPEIGISGAGA